MTKCLHVQPSKLVSHGKNSATLQNQVENLSGWQGSLLHTIPPIPPSSPPPANPDPPILREALARPPYGLVFRTRNSCFKNAKINSTNCRNPTGKKRWQRTQWQNSRLKTNRKKVWNWNLLLTHPNEISIKIYRNPIVPRSIECISHDHVLAFNDSYQIFRLEGDSIPVCLAVSVVGFVILKSIQFPSPKDPCSMDLGRVPPEFWDTRKGMTI